MDFKAITKEELASLFEGEIEAEGWGEIDPYWFKPYSDDAYGISSETTPSEDAEYHEAFQALIERVAKRLNTGKWKQDPK